MVKEGQRTVLTAIEAISGEFAAEIIQRGQSYYVRLDIRWVQYHGLKPHDWVSLRAVNVRRETTLPI